MRLRSFSAFDQSECVKFAKCKQQQWEKQHLALDPPVPFVFHVSALKLRNCDEEFSKTLGGGLKQTKTQIINVWS